MEKFIIEGGAQLKGEVTISGAKNAAVAIIPAAILAQGVCIIENIPNISDVAILCRILQEMEVGIKIINKTTIQIDSTHIGNPLVGYEDARNMRASYYFLGSLLGRCGHASVSMPGGCHFGVRPIDQHIKGFEALGVTVDIDQGMINVKTDRLNGAHIYFDVVSVGATINVMLAAVKARGTTVLENAAREPHIVDLANFLNSMGANIMGAGTDVIKIHGVDMLHAANYSIIPDQIEAGTYMVAAAATHGEVLVKNVIPKHLEAITAKLITAGAEIEEYDDSIFVRCPGPIQKINLKTMPHPGFPTDLQPQMMAMLAVADGTSIVTEGVWDNRYRYVDELCRMGAEIQVDGKVAVVEGVEYLKGARVKAPDLRGGASMMIAAMIARGTSEIEDIYHIERGYENVVDKLQGLGAKIKRVEIPDSVLLKAL